MALRFSLVAFSLLLAGPALVQAQNTPRQLNTLPTVPAPAPDSVRRASQPRQQPAVAVPAPAQSTMQAPPVETSRFAVGLKNGTVYKAYDVNVKQPIFGRTHLMLDDQRRVDMAEVSYYEDETGHYIRTPLPKSSRETTLRRDRVGRLSLYSATSTQYSGSNFGSPFGYGRYGGGYGYGGYGGYGGPMYRTVKTEYFSKDNGPIQDLNVRNLSLATADNPASTALLMQARKYRTYSTLSYVAAGGVIVAGLLSTLNPSQAGSSISPLVYAGIPLAIVPIIFGSKEQKNIKQAISLYNRGAE